MANITKERLDEILAEAPEGTTPAGIVAGLKEQGHTIEGYEEEKPTAGGVGNFLGGAVYGFSSAGRTIQNLASKGVELAGGPKDFGRATRQDFEQATGVDLDRASGQAGELVGEIAPFVVQPTQAIRSIPQATGRLAARFGFNSTLGTAQSGDPVEGGIVGAGGEVLRVAGKVLKAVGSGVFKIAQPVNIIEATRLDKYLAKNNLLTRVKNYFTGKGASKPVARKDTALTKGLWGTQAHMGVQARRASDELWKETIGPTLKASEARASLNTLFQEAEEQIIKNNADPTRQKALLKALNSIKDDFGDEDIVTMERLQALKEGWGKFISKKQLKGEDITAYARTVNEILRSNARKKLLLAVDDPNNPAITQAYIDYGNLVGIAEWGTVGRTNAAFRAGSGGLLNAAKDKVVIPVATIGGRTIYRTGEGIEFIGPAGAKTLYEVINPDEIEQ